MASDTMNEAKWLKILNPILGFLFFAVLITGLLHNKIPYELFMKIHAGGAILLTIAVLLHLWLNRHWIRAAYRKREQKP